MTDLLDRIDAVTAPACAQCTGPLGDSPSADFCSQDCQTAWTRHEHDVQALIGYREAMSDDVNYGHDAARWEPTITVHTWTITVHRATALLFRAHGSYVDALTPPQRLGLTVPTVYVAPERTDSPGEDAWVCEAAAQWADRLGLSDEAAAAREMSREAQREVWAQIATNVGDTCQRIAHGLSEAFKQVSAAFAPFARAVERHHQPPQDPMQAALDARRNRNTGPQVHADPRRNRRRGRGR